MEWLSFVGQVNIPDPVLYHMSALMNQTGPHGTKLEFSETVEEVKKVDVVNWYVTLDAVKLNHFTYVTWT